MNLANIQSYIFRRVRATANTFPASDQVIALNNANEHIHSLIRQWTDLFLPTAWTTSDLSTGTAVPLFDANFHELIGLWVCYDYASENLLPNANSFLIKIQIKERQLLLFYGARDFRVFTTTIASPGVMTKIDHGFSTDDRVTLSSTGALPTGLSVNTRYFVIYKDKDTFNLSLTDSVNSAVAIVTTGSQSGIHYISVFRNSRMTTKWVRHR